MYMTNGMLTTVTVSQGC